MKIWFIEDEPELRALFKELLAEEDLGKDYEVVAVDHVTKCHATSGDIVFQDLQGVGNFYDLKRVEGVNYFIMSGSYSLSDKDDIKVDLAKPFSMTELITLIKKQA